MIPLNVTHLAILTDDLLAAVKGFPGVPSDGSVDDLVPTSRYRNMMSTMLSFFAETYKSTFGFAQGPPLHDPLTIAFVSRPELFKVKRYRVDVDCSHGLGMGQTVVDVWNYRVCDDTWGRNGKNVLVAEDVDVRFSRFLLFLSLMSYVFLPRSKPSSICFWNASTSVTRLLH